MVVAVVACLALLAPPGNAAQSRVRFDIAADLSAGGAGDEIAGTSTMHYRCDSRRRLTNRIWFEGRPGGAGAAEWQRIEPAEVRYRLAIFRDPQRAGDRVRRASVQAPRSSFANSSSDEFRLHSQMTFTCAGHKVVARSETLPLPGIGA
jgi:hypothetical protein